MTRVIVGVDLSGPANAANTALSWFCDDGSRLEFLNCLVSASDADILDVVTQLMTKHSVVVGLDAPLSYNDGGGDRPSDKSLRKAIVQAGMQSGSVMTPTFSKMAYLTLRGLGLTRALGLVNLSPDCVVEVHPGAALVLHGAPLPAVLGFKASIDFRRQLVGWLPTAGVHGVPGSTATTCHQIASCGAALAAWKWTQGQAKWLWKATPPHHPFDFAC